MWVLALIPPVLIQGCLPAKCVELDAGVCTEVREGALYVNSNGCPWGWGCSVVEAVEGETSLNCTETRPSLPLYTSHCGTRLLNKDFLAGHYIVECETSRDCTMQDGEMATCKCSLRAEGRGICVAHLSSSVYDAYWADCVNGHLYSTDAVEMWSLYIALWPLQFSNLPCSQIFTELQELSIRQDTYIAAAHFLIASSLTWI